MKSALFFICVLIITGAASAQTIDVINRSAFSTPGASIDFAFLEPSLDSTKFNFVASIKATGTPKVSDIDVLYNKIKEKALELGANGFRLNSFNRGENKTATLVLDAYFISDTMVYANFVQHEKNVVYIFGDADKSKKSYTFKIDNVKKEIAGGTYYKLILKEGQEVKINKGGFTGATVWTSWKKDRPATFLTLSGFGLGGGPLPPGMAGVALNTGRINYVNGNLGHLIIQVLKQQE